MAAGTGAMFRARTELDAQLLLQEMAARHGGRRPHVRGELLRLAPFAGVVLGAWGLTSLLD